MWWSGATQQTKWTLTLLPSHNTGLIGTHSCGGRRQAFARTACPLPSCVIRQSGHSEATRRENWSSVRFLFFKCQVLHAKLGLSHFVKFSCFCFFSGIKLGFASLLPLLIVLPTLFVSLLEITVQNWENSLICTAIWIVRHFPRYMHGAQMGLFLRRNILFTGL